MTEKSESVKATYCTLGSLSIGDIVVIEHGQEYSNGYWKKWMERKYKYLGYENNSFHFENIEDKYEHCKLTTEDDGMNRLKGKINRQ